MPDVFITATEYHARILRQKMPGKTICSWRGFCEEWLKERKIAVISMLEERVLWHEATYALPFANQEVLLAECIEADRLMQLYGIVPERLQSFDSDAIKLFQQSLAQFEVSLPIAKTTFLRALKTLQVAVLPDRFQQKSFEFFGFVDYPPLYQKIIDNIRNQAEHVKLSSIHIENKVKAEVYQMESAEQEFLFALRHIETQAKAAPHKTFALVVHQSALSWRTIHRILKTESTTLRISYSRGETLFDQPWFGFIKDLLQSLTSTDLLLISRVLTSNFWSEDFERRILLDRLLRENLLATTTLKEVLGYLLYADPEIQHMSWFQIWSHLCAYDLHELTAGLVWSERLLKPVKIEIAFWQEFCDEFKALQNLTAKVSGQAFIALFLNAIIQCDLPSNLPPQPNCHIVGVLEAVMLPVDQVWLLSADTTHYRTQKAQSLFLPKTLLIEFGVSVSLEAVYHYGQNLLAGICRDKIVQASFVGIERGEEKHLSRLILATQEQIVKHKKPVKIAKKELELLQPIPLPIDQVQLVKGGATLLKEQAECPFKAFAHYRLGLRELTLGRAVLDPMQKGLIVHAVLEKIWEQLKSQHALLNLTEEEREHLIASQVDLTLGQLNMAGRKKLIQKLERARLINLIRAWLKQEALRPPFSISGTELNELVTLGSLQFKIRLDRVDTIAEGKKLVIDYKTGEVSAKSWLEERLTEPQLPLYAVAHAAEGALFASLKVGKMGFVGIVKERSEAFDRVQVLEGGKDWASQRAKWREQLEALAEEYQSGELQVAPIDQKACLYCDLASLCRIKEIKA